MILTINSEITTFFFLGRHFFVSREDFIVVFFWSCWLVPNGVSASDYGAKGWVFQRPEGEFLLPIYRGETFPLGEGKENLGPDLDISLLAPRGAKDSRVVRGGPGDPSAPVGWERWCHGGTVPRAEAGGSVLGSGSAGGFSSAHTRSCSVETAWPLGGKNPFSVYSPVQSEKQLLKHCSFFFFNGFFCCCCLKFYLCSAFMFLF